MNSKLILHVKLAPSASISKLVVPFCHILAVVVVVVVVAVVVVAPPSGVGFPVGFTEDKKPI